MAYTEHVCADCDGATFSNTRGPSVCPRCGSENMRHHPDEADERERDLRDERSGCDRESEEDDDEQP